MSVEFQDRVSTYPNRYKVTKPDGTSEYVTLERADEPTTVGTPLNADVFNAAFAEKAPVSHVEDKNNPHGVTAAQVGARPDNWMPTAEEVGAVWDLIWTNLMHTQPFAPQKLSYDLSAYKHFKIELYPAAVTSSKFPLTTVEGLINTPIIGLAYENANDNGGFAWVANRRIELAPDGVTFQSGGYVVIADGTRALNNDYCIPVRIWARRG